jgi:hypothetical protein
MAGARTHRGPHHSQPLQTLSLRSIDTLPQSQDPPHSQYMPRRELHAQVIALGNAMHYARYRTSNHSHDARQGPLTSQRLRRPLRPPSALQSRGPSLTAASRPVQHPMLAQQSQDQALLYPGREARRMSGNAMQMRNGLREVNRKGYLEQEATDKHEERTRLEHMATSFSYHMKDNRVSKSRPHDLPISKNHKYTPRIASASASKVETRPESIPKSDALADVISIYTSSMSTRHISYTISEDNTNFSTRHRLEALRGGNRRTMIEPSGKSQT